MSTCALALTQPYGLEVARWLISRKLIGQGALVLRRFGDAHSAADEPPGSGWAGRSRRRDQRSSWPDLVRNCSKRRRPDLLGSIVAIRETIS
jgi:hypothetical protein